MLRSRINIGNLSDLGVTHGGTFLAKSGFSLVKVLIRKSHQFKRNKHEVNPKTWRI
jgi:hypothetical protein